MRRIGERRGPLKPPLRLNYRQIFILPSRFGLGFSFMTMVMTMAALNFNNNLALILSYLLLSILLFTSVLAYKNLAGVEIKPAITAAVFAGETAIFSISIKVAKNRRWVLQCWQQTQQSQVNLTPGTQAQLLIRKQANTRGRLPLGRWKLQSTWPYGFFRAWSWILPADYCVVYPTPAPAPPVLPFAGLQGQQLEPAQSGDDELQGLHEYQHGEPLNRIAWRSSARADKLISRESEQTLGGEVSLNWDAITTSSLEEKLSILCAWALQSESMGLKWGLKIPGFELKPDTGKAHLHQALRQLALFGDDE